VTVFHLLGRLQPLSDGLPHVGELHFAVAAGRGRGKTRRHCGHEGRSRRSDGGRRGGGRPPAGKVFDVLGGDHAVHAAAARNPGKVDAAFGRKLLGCRARERPVAGNGSPDRGSDGRRLNGRDRPLRMRGMGRGRHGSSEIFIDSLSSLK